jgi:DnaJ-class molecular chaperone
MDNIDPFEIFQAFFGGMHPDMFGPMGGGVHFAQFGGGPGMRFRMGGQRHHHNPHGPFQHQRRMHTIKVSLEDMYKGTKRRINDDEIDIPKGSSNGDRVTSSIGSNVYVLEEIPHAHFARRGNDLEYTAILSLSAWLLTGQDNYVIKHLDGTTIKVNLRPFLEVWFQPSAAVRGRGMPTSNSRFGDLIVYSSCLSREQRAQFMSFLRGIGTIILIFLVMTNPSLLFLVLLLKPLFA